MLMDDIQAYLQAHLVDESGRWPVLIGVLPQNQDRGIGLFETGGYPATEINRETETVTFQLLVRANRQEYAVARQKYQDCFDLLQDAQQTGTSPNVFLPGVVFIQALGRGPLQFNEKQPGTMAQAVQSRPMFSANFKCCRYV